MVTELDAVEAAADDAFLSRDLNGAVQVQDNAVTVVRTATEAAAANGLDVTDADGDAVDGSGHAGGDLRLLESVSYTHLTLPTNREV